MFATYDPKCTMMIKHRSLVRFSQNKVGQSKKGSIFFITLNFELTYMASVIGVVTWDQA